MLGTQFVLFKEQSSKLKHSISQRTIEKDGTDFESHCIVVYMIRSSIPHYSECGHVQSHSGARLQLRLVQLGCKRNKAIKVIFSFLSCNTVTLCVGSGHDKGVKKTFCPSLNNNKCIFKEKKKESALLRQGKFVKHLPCPYNAKGNALHVWILPV